MSTTRTIEEAVLSLLGDMLNGCPEALSTLTEKRVPLSGEELAYVEGHPGLVPYDDGAGNVELGVIGILQGLLAKEGVKLVLQWDSERKRVTGYGMKRIA